MGRVEASEFAIASKAPKKKKKKKQQNTAKGKDEL